MKQSELPKCPTCGAMPEYRWRERSQGTSHGTLKCPYDHHEVYRAYQSGSKNKATARSNLIAQWIALVEGQLRQGAAQ